VSERTPKGQETTLTDTSENSAESSPEIKERPAHLWKPGQSGNPLGRPPTKGIAQLFKNATRGGQEAIEAVAEICRSGKRDRDRLEAAKIILERIYGKAIEVTVDATEAAARGLVLAPDQLEAIARVLLPAKADQPVIDAEIVSTEKDESGSG
jgi:hypothetical protein